MPQPPLEHQIRLEHLNIFVCLHLCVCLEEIFLCLQLYFTHRMQEGMGVLIHRGMIYTEEVQVLCSCCGKQAVTLPGFQFLGNKEMGVGGGKVACILFRGRSASWPFHSRQERAVLIVLPGNESLRCSLWLNTPQLNSTSSSLAPLHSWPEGKINLVTRLNKRCFRSYISRIALRVRELTEVPASRCQGQTAGLVGKCRDISAECSSPAHLVITQNCSYDKNEISVFIICAAEKPRS